MPKVNRTTPSKSHTQSVVFSKKNFSLSQARSWLKRHKMYTDGLDETENSYRFRQYNTSPDFRYRTKQIQTGIVLVMAFPKGSPKKIDEIILEKVINVILQLEV